ncbi:MAG: RdgB/HAM1 family non-canonical purine NTP pyrophosphatase [Hyphomicrobiales bacterium]
MRPRGVLETVVYAANLDAARDFYGRVLGLELKLEEPGRHVFFALGHQMVLVFNPDATRRGTPNPKFPVPGHGADGEGHICFAADAEELDQWIRALDAAGVAIEADFEWPGGGRSVYVRDPAGNSVEFAERRIWGFDGGRVIPAGSRLVVASHNMGKVREIRDLLKPFGLEAIAAGEIGLPEPEETGTTFAANAVLKAKAAAKASGLPALSDDSGLCVDALSGEPGIYSARWAGPRKDFALAMDAVEKKLVELGATKPAARKAHFVCALALAFPDGESEVFEGRVDGTLVWPPRGEKGFGYDPMFQANGMTETFGEIEPEAKHAMSHRAKAFEQLKARLEQR